MKYLAILLIALLLLAGCVSSRDKDWEKSITKYCRDKHGLTKEAYDCRGIQEKLCDNTYGKLRVSCRTNKCEESMLNCFCVDGNWTPDIGCKNKVLNYDDCIKEGGRIIEGSPKRCLYKEIHLFSEN